jgi:2-polyprenyl-3-methyl-5-hydroxy-6-metoxy-1,4-benzoquinol methylase
MTVAPGGGSKSGSIPAVEEEEETRPRMPERGKPAEYGQEIVRRRGRLTRERVPLKGKVVLDYGCGNGAQTVEFAADGCKVFAVDVDRQDLDTFDHHLRQEGITSIEVKHYDGVTLPLAGASVDVVVSYEVLEHVGEEAQALQEWHRVLRGGGDLIITVPNKWWIFETHGAYLPLLPWHRVPFFSWLPRRLHGRFAKARIYRKPDIVQALTSHSFNVLEAAYVTAPMDVVRIPWLKRLLRAIVFRGDLTSIPFLSTAILVHARKQ